MQICTSLQTDNHASTHLLGSVCMIVCCAKGKELESLRLDNLTPTDDGTNVPEKFVEEMNSYISVGFSCFILSSCFLLARSGCSYLA